MKVTDTHGCTDSAGFTIHPAVLYNGERIKVPGCRFSVSLGDGDVCAGGNLKFFRARNHLY